MFVALGLFLKQCPQVITLGVKPQFTAYTRSEINLIKEAKVVLFPTWRYLPIFEATSKETFPSTNSYHYKRSVHLQFSLASYLNIPRLRTRLFAGSRQKSSILSEFSLPVKVFYGPSFKKYSGTICEKEELERVVSLSHSVIVQEAARFNNIEVELIFLNFSLIGWKGINRIDRIYEVIVEKSLHICKQAGIDDISIKWINYNGTWKFAGMKNPPLYFNSFNGLSSRKHVLCEMLKDISTGEVIPPWIRIHESRI